MTAHAALATAAALVFAGPAARAQPARPASTVQAAEFESLASRADAARVAGRLDEADGLYREALRLRPGWAPGWGHVGTMAYERDRFSECREAFRRLVALEPKAGPAWALRGLCEFGLQAYPAARRSLDQATLYGGLAQATLLPVVLYHQSLLRILASEFEAAIPPLSELASASPETTELVTACGLLLLRRPLLPAAVPASERELVERAGRAHCSYLGRRPEEARARYQQLLARYPTEEHLHYGYGQLLAQQTDVAAADQFRKEIELHPGHVLAHLELAFELLTARSGAAGGRLGAGGGQARPGPVRGPPRPRPGARRQRASPALASSSSRRRRGSVRVCRRATGRSPAPTHAPAARPMPSARGTRSAGSTRSGVSARQAAAPEPVKP